MTSALCDKAKQILYLTICFTWASLFFGGPVFGQDIEKEAPKSVALDDSGL